MRISKAIKPIIIALGGQASEIGGKSLSKIANYIAPYAEAFIKDPIKNNSIATSKIKDGAISTNKIKAKAITEDKLSDELVSKIGQLVVVYTENEGEFSTETQYSDIVNAINNGRCVVALAGATYLPLQANDDGAVIFGTIGGDSSLSYAQIKHSSDGAIEFTLIPIN